MRGSCGARAGAGAVTCDGDGPGHGTTPACRQHAATNGGTSVSGHGRKYTSEGGKFLSAKPRVPFGIKLDLLSSVTKYLVSELTIYVS